MGKYILVTAAMLSVVSCASAQSQQKSSGKPNNVAVAGIQQIYSMAKEYIMKAAEQVPEDKYSFQPTKDVRTFGQILGHIVDGQAAVCSSAAGNEKPYTTDTEKNVSKKLDLVARLKESFATCDIAYASVSDADLSTNTTVFGQPASVSHALALNTAHILEHYGNLVTYMRILGLVPPSSQTN